MRRRVQILNLPIAPMTVEQTVDATAELIDAGRPTYFITANTQYAMLSTQLAELADVNARAAFIVADGAPLVWASRLAGARLPERVAGADLIHGICQRAATRGDGIFLLGGAHGVAAEAGRRLRARYPGLRVVGTASPPFRQLATHEQWTLIDQIRAARPDVLFVAMGQPKGELWIAKHYQALGVPVSVQIGAALDFVAGKVRRAPRPLQRLGFEWAYRMWLEPARLAPRYARNALFLARSIARERLGQAEPDGALASGIPLHLAEADS